MSDLERLMKFVEPVTESGCWIWMGCMLPKGYGQFRLNGAATVAHKAAYLLIKGDYDQTLDLDHLCRVRCCVNPDHLEPVTRQENLRRGDGAKLVGKTKCMRGHALPENLYFTGSKKLARCKECDRIRRKRQPQKSPDEMREYSRQQYLKHREKRLASIREYQRNNREKINALSRDRKRRIRAAARGMEMTQA